MSRILVITPGSRDLLSEEVESSFRTFGVSAQEKDAFLQHLFSATPMEIAVQQGVSKVVKNKASEVLVAHAASGPDEETKEPTHFSLQCVVCFDDPVKATCAICVKNATTEHLVVYCLSCLQEWLAKSDTDPHFVTPIVNIQDLPPLIFDVHSLHAYCSENLDFGRAEDETDMDFVFRVLTLVGEPLTFSRVLTRADTKTEERVMALRGAFHVMFQQLVPVATDEHKLLVWTRPPTVSSWLGGQCPWLFLAARYVKSEAVLRAVWAAVPAMATVHPDAMEQTGQSVLWGDLPSVMKEECRGDGEVLRLQIMFIAMKIHLAHPTIQEQACHCLSAMAAQRGDNRSIALTTCTKIALLGGIDAVLAAMNTHQDYTPVQLAGCIVLASLAKVEPVKLAILNLNGAEAIVAAMKAHSNQEAVAGEGCRALRSVCPSTIGRVKLLSLGGIEVIVAALQSYGNSMLVQCCGIQMLSFMIEVKKDSCARILSLGGMEAVVAALLSHGHNNMAQGACCSVLACLTENDAASCDKFMALDGLDAVVAVLHGSGGEPTELAQVCACLILMHLARCAHIAERMRNMPHVLAALEHAKSQPPMLIYDSQCIKVAIDTLEILRVPN